MARKMKDSGIKWIGEIPENWKVVPLKYLTKFYNGYSFNSNDLINPYKFPVIRIGDIHGDEVDLDSSLGVMNNYGLDKYKISRNDILLAMSGATVGKIGIVKENLNAYINQRVGIIRSRFYKYIFYNLLTSSFIDYIFINADGSAQPNISQKMIEEYRLTIPSEKISKIKVITDFLDKKTEKISEIKSTITKQIECLEEYKKSVITEAVTKGLDKNVKMKDSGIEWIGEIPEHWEVKKIKNILKRKEDRNPGNKSILSVYRDYGVIPKDSRDDNYNVTSLDTNNYKYVKPNYLVINKMKAWQGSMGISEYEGVVSPAYYVYVIKDLNVLPKYIHFTFRNIYPDYFRRISGGIREGQWDLSAFEFENSLFIIPPLTEQQQIVSYLDKKTKAIDETINAKKKQLEVLEEYKKSLIYEYVTGKREVGEDDAEDF